MGLYLLIWGEAANVRFMPECLCYIYHHMAFELCDILSGNVSLTTGKNVKPAYSGEDDVFLKKVVTPIYKVIEKEAEKSKTIQSKHSNWRNYDDLNEYIWSKDCFQLGWPMRVDADFFNTTDNAPRDQMNGENRQRWMGKVNFIESRSFWHIFRSFDRMWSFLILSLQAMIIIAWNGGTPSDIFEAGVFKQVLSIFITTALLNLGQACLDIVLSWKARRSMSFALKLRYILKLLSAAAWAIILPLIYLYTRENRTGLARTVKSWLHDGQDHASLYIWAVVIYLAPNMLAAVLFLFPLLRSSLEKSSIKGVTFMMWWSQPRLFVGRGMNEGIVSLIKYTMFWVVLLAAKLIMSYYMEIRPLVQLTKDIMKEPIKAFQLHELFPNASKNFAVVVALWAPIILVYFIDTQIWYAILSTLIGGVCGAFRRLGEIRTLGMLRSRFQYLPNAFNQVLIPSELNKRGAGFCNNPSKISEDGKEEERLTARFSQIWNLIITSLREEDLINNREKDMLLVPYFKDPEIDTIQWPLFLLASKIPIAIDMAVNSGGKDRDLKKRMELDPYFSYALKECYSSLRNIIYTLVVGLQERDFIEKIFIVVDNHITQDTLIRDLNMSKLYALYRHFVDLLYILQNNSKEDQGHIIILFQDMFEVVTNVMEGQLSGLLEVVHGGNNKGHGGTTPYDEEDQLFTKAINFPVKESNEWATKIKRLYLLLTLKGSAMDVPSNLEARRRLTFFANSVFMKMPCAPKVRQMLPFSVLTPYYKEDVLFSSHMIATSNEDGVSILFYLQNIYPDEWNNFLERVQCQDEEELFETERLEEEVRLWASYRSQTLTRTVRGMMYYRQALVLQSFLDMAGDDDLMGGFRESCGLSGKSPLLTQCKAVADMKFMYVISCQQYSIQKRSGDPRAQDILRLMTSYPSLRVAYIDEIEERSGDRNTIEKVYYSVLVKAAVANADNPGQEYDQDIYRIKLPGNAMLGEGKAENQNHAIIFTRGEGLQTIDTNQEHYMEETLKIRNLLQEFLIKHNGVSCPSILGVREHIFTGSVSSLAWFMSNQETSIVTIGQRVLANPLRVRFHYGHADIFDRLFHLTRGGISKQSNIINLSKDIFAGFNSTLREGNVTHHEYVQVGKGRHVGLNQISNFEAEIAYGNGEQTLSRDVYRLGQCFDFFRMLSCYHTTIGFYFTTMITVCTVYVFLYGRLYLILGGLDEAPFNGKSFMHNGPLEVALVSESLVQLGFLVVLPMMMEIGLERGFGTALSDFVLMQLQLASVFFTFSLGTKSHYYGRTLLHGGEHRVSGRGFVVFHSKFAENYRLYSRSHFVKGLELLILLVVNEIIGQSYQKDIPSIFITFSMWFMVVTWLFAPFLFNPSGFEWQKIVDDWTDWNKWISYRGGIGIPPERSWESWWEKEQEPLNHSGKLSTAVEIVLALRFFIYQYGLVYHLNITKRRKSVLVYGLSWAVIFVILLVMKTVSVGRQKFRGSFELAFRLIKGLISVTFVSIIIVLITTSHLTLQDIFVCILAFAPTGWGLLLIAKAFKPAIDRIGLWGSIRAIARGYESIMGLLVFIPIAFFAWFPFVSELQTRMLFNQAFIRGLQISRVLGGRKMGRRTPEKLH